MKDMDLTVTSDLVIAGITEDGDEDIRQSFYVLAEFADGTRFRHFESFCTATGYPDPETDEARAEQLLSRIEDAGGLIDRQHWVEIDPRYGSDAYIHNNIEEQRWMEERQEAMGGY